MRFVDGHPASSPGPMSQIVDRDCGVLAGPLMGKLCRGALITLTAGTDVTAAFEPWIEEIRNGAVVKVYLTDGPVAVDTDLATTGPLLAAAINALHLVHGVHAEASGADVALTWAKNLPATPRVGADFTGDAEAEFEDFAYTLIELTAGTGGGSATYDVQFDGVSISGGAVAFNTSLDQTAQDAVAAILAEDAGPRAWMTGTATFAVSRAEPGTEPAVTVDVGGNGSADVGDWVGTQPPAEQDLSSVAVAGVYELTTVSAQFIDGIQPEMNAIEPRALDITNDEDVTLHNGRLDLGVELAAGAHAIPWVPKATKYFLRAETVPLALDTSITY